MLHYFAAHAAHGNVRPFVAELAQALATIDTAVPSLAVEMLDRIAAIRGIGEDPYESIIQILAEIYVAEGAVTTADRDDVAHPVFSHEPRTPGGKNPEFDACGGGRWYAVEVKTPRLIDYGRQREQQQLQLTARLPNPSAFGPATLPRDNPVKDFLVSADAKFEAYNGVRPDASAILTIVWDDFVQEAVSALSHPQSGLFTERSFLKDKNGQAVQFPNVDAVVLIRHQHQIIRATREEPLGDGQQAFRYHGPPFPPKALVTNPRGTPIPTEIIDALGATPIEDLAGYAEYTPPDLIIWTGGDAPDEAT